jgi:trigger factor
MQVRIEDVSPVEKKLSVEIPWETVSQKLGVAYRELAKDAALKGFRKGKVPRPVLEQVYGQRIAAEVATQMVRETFYRATEEHKLAAVAEPQVKEASAIKKGQPFTFAAIIEVRGEVVPQGYKGLEIERRRLAIAETAVEEAIAQLVREHTELRPIEGREVTAAGDVVGLTINGKIGEHDVSQPQFAVDLDDAEREPLPGLRAALTGIRIDSKDQAFEAEIPADFKDESLRGRKATLTFSVIEARVKDVPKLDDEFAKDTGKGETLAELRAAVRKDLEAKEQEQIDREAREGALRELIKKNQIPVAGSLIERAVELQYGRLRQMLGMPPERNLAGLGEELRSKMRPAGADEVRGQLLLEAISESEKLEITEAELDAHIQATAKARNTPPAKLRAEWQRDGRLENVGYSLRQDKVLGFLVEHAKVTEVEKLTQQGTPIPGAPEAPHGDEGHVHGPDCNH